MSYEKTTWTAGDVITSEKLNHLEEGVEEAANRPVVASENGTITMSATYSVELGRVFVEHGYFDGEKHVILANRTRVTTNTAVPIVKSENGYGINVQPNDVFGNIVVTCDGVTLESIDDGIVQTRFILPVTAESVTITVTGT